MIRTSLFVFIILFATVNEGNTQNEGSTSIDMFYFEKGKAFFSMNYDSSEYYFLKAIPLLENKKSKERYVETLNFLSALYYYDSDMKSFFDYATLANRTAKKYLIDTSSNYMTSIANLGVYYNLKGHSLKAIEYYKLALSLVKNNTHKASVLNMLGFEYRSINDYEQALIYFHQELELREDSIKIIEDVLGDNYFNLGRTYYQMEQFDSTFKFFKKSEMVFSKLPRGQYVNDRLIQVLQELTFFYIETNKTDSAFFYLQKADSFYKKHNTRAAFMNKELLGRYYKLQKNYGHARAAFQNAIELVQEENKTIYVLSAIANQYNNLANFEFELKNYNEALNNYQKALARLFYNFEDKKYPNPSNFDVIHPFRGVQTLHGKAKTLYQLYLKNGDIQDLELSLSTYQLAAQLIQKTRQDIMTSGSKQLLAGEVLPVYEGAIQTALKMHEVTGDQNYLQQAFQFAESNKAILLLESINEQVAKSYGGIPDSLQEQERDLRIDVAFYEKNINQEKQKGEKADQEKISKWEKELFEIQQQYSNVIDLLEKEYPKYYAFKYDTKLVDLQTIQDQILDQKSVLLEYFVGEAHLFLFRITKADLQVFTYPKTEEYERNIQRLLDLVNSPATNMEVLAAFADESYKVYNSYLASALADLPAQIHRLIIVPDDRLTYLPFEVLLKNPYQGKQEQMIARELDYLLKDYQLNYSYSATLLLNSFKKQKRRTTKSLLAMAPSFKSPLAGTNRNCSPENLYSLHCSPNEAQTISDKLNGKSIIGKEAVKAHFLEQASQYRILHLATHSCSDQENPMMSKIYFADGDVSNYDLYNMELNAELAVLSSCNSGSGKLVKGEGVMSLSKGFIHAGCPSTLISLWSVDDCATSDIMIDFYNKLDKGYAKDKALQKAKLTYLNSVNKIRQHPYYWAAFVQMGNFEPLERNRVWSKTYSVVGLLIIIGGVVFWNRRKKKRAA